MPYMPSRHNPEQEKLPIDSKNTINKQDIISDLTVSISVESAKLLEASTEKNFNNFKVIELASNLKQKLELILDFLSEPDKTSDSTFTDINHKDSPYCVKAAKAAGITDKELEFRSMARENERMLDNGGMAPPKEWKNITNINLKSSQKNSLIEEMRKMKEHGQKIDKSSHTHKITISVSEFLEPFGYLENMHDYNGAFLISLLKSHNEINNMASAFQIDLSKEREACSNGDCLILSVYDISGSSDSEEKKFLIVLIFDKLNGILKFGYPIFAKGKKNDFSLRQKTESEKFCKAKKINH